MKKIKKRQIALDILSKQSPDVLEAIAIVVEDADVEGNYVYKDEGCEWQYDAYTTKATLWELAREIRQLKQ